MPTARGTSELRLNGEGQFVRPAGKSRGRGLASLAACGGLREEGPFGVGEGELAVELEILEAVDSDVVTGGGVHETRDARPVAGGQAHGARLTARVQHGVFHQMAPELRTGRTQGHDLGVCRGIAEFDNRTGTG